MKKVLRLIIITVLFISCSSEPHYVIKGEIAGGEGNMFYLRKKVSGQSVIIDSTKITNGKFTIKGGAVEYPEIVSLINKETGSGFSFYLENTNITIKGSIDTLENVRISGSKTQDEQVSYSKSQKILDDSYNLAYSDFVTAKEAGDEVKASQIESNLTRIENEMTLLDKEFVQNHPASYLVPNILNNLSYYLNASELEAILNGLDSGVAKSPVIVALKSQVEVMKKVEIGKKAPDFTMNDPDGNPVTLSSKIGKKLLLVDFWAGWCGPCRQENPNLVKVYNEFNKKGFDVLGVSLDRTRDVWLKAVADDKITWTQVSDLQYFDNMAAKMYGVNAIPANFLLDENGIIIGRNLRGQELRQKIADLLSVK